MAANADNKAMEDALALKAAAEAVRTRDCPCAYAPVRYAIYPWISTVTQG